jgi:hypothetical protein
MLCVPSQMQSHVYSKGLDSVNLFRRMTPLTPRGEGGEGSGGRGGGGGGGGGRNGGGGSGGVHLRGACRGVGAPRTPRTRIPAHKQ